MNTARFNTILWIIAIIGLGLTLIPSILLFCGTITSSVFKLLLAVGTAVWFAARILVKEK